MLKELKVQEKRINNFLIISKIKRQKDKVIVKCNCGHYKRIRYKDIISLKSKTCGHCSLMLIKIGDVFGKLTVTGFNNGLFKVRCECGKNKTARCSELNKGKIKTCGLSIHKTGKNNSNWKGGIRNVSNNIRKSKDYKDWRQRCFERDGYSCQISGQKGGKLVVHHLEPFQLLIDENKLLFDINNGVTITEELHKEFHKAYGVKFFTKDNFLIFKKNKC